MQNVFLVAYMQVCVFACGLLQSIIRDNKIIDNKNRPYCFLANYKLGKNFPIEYMLLISKLHVAIWKSQFIYMLQCCCITLNCLFTFISTKKNFIFKDWQE